MVTDISCEIQLNNMEIGNSSDSDIDGDSFTILTVLNSDEEDSEGVVALGSDDSDFVILGGKEESQALSAFKKVGADYSQREVVKVKYYFIPKYVLIKLYRAE